MIEKPQVGPVRIYLAYGALPSHHSFFELLLALCFLMFSQLHHASISQTR